MKKSIVYSFLALGISANAWAGANSTGGGGAAVCRDANRHITLARLIDIYEGQVRFKFKYASSQAPIRDQVLNALKNIPNSFDRTMAVRAASAIITSMQFLPDGVGMAPSTDLGNAYGTVVPSGCVIEPVGFYESDGKLMVSREVYTALSLTERAAFLIHEALYKVARDTSYATDSALSRRAVAAIFATNSTADDVNSLLQMLIYSPEHWRPFAYGTDVIAKLAVSSNERLLRFYQPDFGRDANLDVDCDGTVPSNQVPGTIHLNLSNEQICRVDVHAAEPRWPSNSLRIQIINSTGDVVVDKVKKLDDGSYWSHLRAVITLEAPVMIPAIPEL